MAADPLASCSTSLPRPSLLLSSLPPFPPEPAWPRTSPWLVPGANTASFRLARFRPVKVHAVVAQSGGPPWWQRNCGPNMIDIHSAEEFLNALSQAGDRLVVVEFYGTWCASCRAMFPKLCRTAKDNSDVIFLKVDFDVNDAMCKRLNVKVVPYFQFYRGADGQLEAFSCSLAKFQRIKEAIATHNTPRCSIGPSFNVEGLALLDT